MRPATAVQVNNSSSMEAGEVNEFSTLWNDPLAHLLIKLHLLGPNGFQRWKWPIVFTFFYFVLNDLFLPVLLHRFSSKAGYIGPFDPLLIPYRIVDGILVPALVYYYGRTSLLFPAIFDRLVENGIFGPPQNEEVRPKIELQRQIFIKCIGSIWLTPLAIALALWITVNSSVEYTSPPRPHSFINSDSYVFFFNLALWLLNYYMVAMIVMRFILLAFWLQRLYYGKRLEWHSWLKVDVLHTDNRMGFKPITDCAVLAAKIIVVVLLSFVFIFKSNQNIGLPPANPSWLGYLFILVLGLPVVIFPIYLVHKFMQYEKDRLIREISKQMGVTHSDLLLHNWFQLGEEQQINIFTAQVLLMRLAQVPDWPVTVEEIVTVFFTYLLGTVLAMASTLQTIVDFITK